MREIINNTENFIKTYFLNDSTGHDWYHMLRVRNNAMLIQKHEQQGNPFIIEMSALLHDYIDDKLQDDPDKAKKEIEVFLEEQGVKNEAIAHIFEIINTISYKGGQEATLSTIEARIVRDADRLDAIGAIGIARTFAYGGKKGSLIYDPELPIRENMTLDEYRNGRSTSIHHFYEKLLKLKDLMLTETGKKLAEDRHQYMINYVEQFFYEWNGER